MHEFFPGILIGAFGIGVALVIMAAYILGLSFIAWMAVDAAKHDRFWWLVVIIALPLVGAIVYFFIEKKKMYFKVEKVEKKEDNTKSV